MYIYIYICIYMVNFIQKSIEFFYYTVKCKYMSLNVGMEPYIFWIYRIYREYIVMLIVKPSAILKLLDQYECSKACVS